MKKQVATLLLFASCLYGCSQVSPSGAAASPSPPLRPSTQPSPSQTIGYTVECGPLAISPDDCDAAVRFAMQVMLPFKDYSLLRVATPEPSCSGSCGNAPIVVVQAFKGGALVTQIPLARTDGGWQVVLTPM